MRLIKKQLRRKRTWYPSVNDIKNYNQKVLNIYRATKADHHEILSESKLKESLVAAKKQKGSIEDKAASLMLSLNQAHAFGSANKRTAYFSANKMLWKNKNYSLAIKRDKQKEFAVKVREGKASDKEIAKFLGK